MLAEWVDELLSSYGLAKSTKKRYDSILKKLVSFHNLVGVYVTGSEELANLDCDFLLLLLAWQSKFSTWSQIRKLIPAIKNYFKLTYSFDPFTETLGLKPLVGRFKLERAIREIKRKAADMKKRPKFALCKFMLAQIKQFFNMNRYNHSCVWAMLCLAVDCLLRWSEVCYTSKDNIDKILSMRDWTKVNSKMYSLRLHDTKTKLFGDAMLVTATRNTTEVCAVTALETYIKKFRPTATLDEPLFRAGGEKIGSKVLAMSSQEVQKILLEMLRKVVSEEELESGVSPRRGGATTLALCGVPDRVIQAYGRWRSWSYKVYIELHQSEKDMWADIVNRQVKSKEPVKPLKKGRMEWIVYGDLPEDSDDEAEEE